MHEYLSVVVGPLASRLIIRSGRKWEYRPTPRGRNGKLKTMILSDCPTLGRELTRSKSHPTSHRSERTAASSYPTSDG